MNPPTEPFNQIKVTWTCDRCHCKYTGQRYQVAGGHLMGRVLLMQYVCAGCRDAHAQAITDGFVGDMAKPRGAHCHGCADKLSSGESFVAHLYLKEDGTWEHSRVCGDCFGEYKSLCKQLSAGNKTKEKK